MSQVKGEDVPQGWMIGSVTVAWSPVFPGRAILRAVATETATGISREIESTVFIKWKFR